MILRAILFGTAAIACTVVLVAVNAATLGCFERRLEPVFVFVVGGLSELGGL